MSADERAFWCAAFCAVYGYDIDAGAAGRCADVALVEYRKRFGGAK